MMWGGIKAQDLFPNDSLSISREGPGGWSQGPEMLAGALLHPSNFHRIVTRIHPRLGWHGLVHPEVTAVTCMREGPEDEGSVGRAKVRSLGTSLCL